MISAAVRNERRSTPRRCHKDGTRRLSAILWRSALLCHTTQGLHLCLGYKADALKNTSQLDEPLNDFVLAVGQDVKLSGVTSRLEITSWTRRARKSGSGSRMSSTYSKGRRCSGKLADGLCDFQSRTRSSLVELVGAVASTGVAPTSSFTGTGGRARPLNRICTSATSGCASMAAISVPARRFRLHPRGRRPGRRALRRLRGG